MRILIKSRKWVEDRLDKDMFFCRKYNFISIFSSGDYSPFPEQSNSLLELEFDDITDSDRLRTSPDAPTLILFHDDHAAQIVRFIHRINRKKTMIIHCDAGISRSGAVGQVLNEYCNRILENNPNDYALFAADNPDIIPNPLVFRILQRTFPPLSNRPGH